MARIFRTLSLSLPPGVFKTLAKIGKKTGCTGARVATKIVLHEIATTPTTSKPKRPLDPSTRRKSWCCHGRVVSVQGPLVIIDEDKTYPDRRWIPVTVLLCGTCKRQLHGSEYEGWLSDV